MYQVKLSTSMFSSVLLDYIINVIDTIYLPRNLYMYIHIYNKLHRYIYIYTLLNLQSLFHIMTVKFAQPFLSAREYNLLNTMVRFTTKLSIRQIIRRFKNWSSAYLVLSPLVIVPFKNTIAKLLKLDFLSFT